MYLKKEGDFRYIVSAITVTNLSRNIALLSILLLPSFIAGGQDLNNIDSLKKYYTT